MRTAEQIIANFEVDNWHLYGNERDAVVKMLRSYGEEVKSAAIQIAWEHDATGEVAKWISRSLDLTGEKK